MADLFDRALNGTANHRNGDRDHLGTGEIEARGGVILRRSGFSRRPGCFSSLPRTWTKAAVLFRLIGFRRRF
jgi:hypothetical protein